MKILVTGFSSFPGVPINPCEQVVEWISKKYSNESVVVSILPVSYCRSATAVTGLIQAHCPDVVVELGVSNRTTGIRLERVGYNARNTQIPDVDGMHCAIQPIVHTLPYNFAKQTVLPIAALHEYLKASAQIEVSISVDPGRYVCNSLYWETLHQFPETPSLFIHIPPVDETNRSAVNHAIGMVLDWMLSNKIEQNV
jgi:pyroglutamyl-peptidase